MPRGLLVVAVVCSALAACGEDGTELRGEEGPAPIVVSAADVATLTSGTLDRGPLVSGYLTPERQADVRAETGGAILDVRAEPGQRVARGAVLARIDQAGLQDQLISARSAVRSAATAVDLARREVARLETLVEAGAVAEQELENARRTLSQAEAARAEADARLALAEKQIEQTTVRSPMAGVVSERPVNRGDVVQAGALLFTVVDPSSMRLEGSVPAAQLADVKVGDRVQFEVTGYPGRAFEGRVSRINPTADPATGQVRLIVSLPNVGGTLVGGLFARGRISVETEAGVIAPAAAVGEGQGPALTVVRDGVVHRVPVEVGLRDPLTEQVIVRSGVQPGDVVLLGAARGLSDGTPVVVPRGGTPVAAGMNP